jgi:hypothetical protein
VLYRTEVLAEPTYPLPYELNVNDGPEIPSRIDVAGGEPFWFLLDVATARECSLTVGGPTASTLIAPVPDDLVVTALRDALRWHAAHGDDRVDVVLNACRAWYWLENRAWASKTAAGRWVLEDRGGHPIVAAAVSARVTGDDQTLDVAAVATFARSVRRRVMAAR